MSIHQTALHAAIREHLDATGQSMRGLSLRAGLGVKCVADILHRPGLRPTRRTLELLSTAVGAPLPAPAAVPPQTYAELIAALEGADDPSGASRTQAKRLRWLMRSAGWVPETEPVDRRKVIEFLAANAPATFDLTPGSYSTYKSDMLKGIDGMHRRARPRDVRDVGGVHRELQQRVRACEALPDDLRNLGGSFFVYLHDEGIVPSEVTTEVLARYHRHRLETGVRTEATCIRHVKRVADLLSALRDLPEFEHYDVAAPPHPFGDGRRKYGGREADAAIAPLLAEFDAHAAPRFAGKKAALAKGGKAKPKGRRGAEAEALARLGFLLPDERWGDQTLANRRAFVAAGAAALLAERGYRIETLDELTDPDVVEAVAETLDEANEGEDPSSYVATGLKGVRKVARDLLGRPDADIARITEMIVEYDPGHKGIAPRNRRKLRAFTRARGDAFLDMSSAMAAEIQDEITRRKKAARAEGASTSAAAIVDSELARRVMLVVAHDVMTARAPRSANAIQARLDWVGWQDGLATIVVPAAQVKGREGNDPDLAIPLGPQPSRFLRQYTEVIRPRALREGDEGNPHLFPSPGGRDWRPGQPYRSVLRCLCREVHRRVGVRVHPHLYRHLVGWLWLRDEPWRLPEVSRILGHSSSETTARYYAEVDEQIALTHWQEYLNDRREQRDPAPAPRRPRRGR